MAKEIVVSLGHSNADARATKVCIDAGARHATHTFNAMRPLDHREPGILGVVLSDDRVSADIIVDGVHVSPEMVRLFLRAKGNKAVLITDAISATGMPDGRFKLGSFEVEVKGDRCVHNGKLAGSVLTLDRAIRNLMSFANFSLEAAIHTSAAAPANVLGLPSPSLASGEDANLIVLSPATNLIATFST